MALGNKAPLDGRRLLSETASQGWRRLDKVRSRKDRRRPEVLGGAGRGVGRHEHRSGGLQDVRERGDGPARPADDASGLPLTVTVGSKQVAAFAHDAPGNRTSATDPNSGATTFTHTALGRTLTATNALGQTTTYGYDKLGRLTSRSDADGKAFWEYDPTNYDWQIQPHLSLTATGVKVGDDNSPADEPLFTGRQWISIGVGILPGAGSVQSIVELVTGYDYIAGEEVDRRLAAAGIFAGAVLGGKAALKVGSKIAPKVIRKLDTKPSVEDLGLQRVVDQLYREGDNIPGGTAGALRKERIAGVRVGGKRHDIKARERINQLRNMARDRQDLSSSDRMVLEELVADLEDALKTPGIDP